MTKTWSVIAVISALLLGGWVLFADVKATVEIDEKQAIASLEDLSEYSETVKTIKPPKITQPKWYKDQVAAERRAAQAAAQAPVRRSGDVVTVTYSVSTKGQTRSDLAQFAAQAQETLNSDRGWAQLGIAFQQVPSGGSFSLILSDASQVPTFSPGCSAQWSCRVGTSVIINDDRWSGATTAWNNAGGGLRDYRHMVINHEVGHWLGHGHVGCSGAGAYAPVMLQQSIDLGGCKFNPWPLASELSAPNLGL